jgi:hypothetical protein
LLPNRPGKASAFAVPFGAHAPCAAEASPSRPTASRIQALTLSQHHRRNRYLTQDDLGNAASRVIRTPTSVRPANRGAGVALRSTRNFAPRCRSPRHPPAHTRSPAINQIPLGRRRRSNGWATGLRSKRAAHAISGFRFSLRRLSNSGAHELRTPEERQQGAQDRTCSEAWRVCGPYRLHLYQRMCC